MGSLLLGDTQTTKEIKSLLLGDTHTTKEIKSLKFVMILQIILKRKYFIIYVSGDLMTKFTSSANRH